MRRADHPTSVDIGGGIIGYTEGDPGTGVAPTVLEADQQNHIQEELATAIEGFGITLDAGNMSQLLEALGFINEGVYGDGSGGDITTAGDHTQTADEYRENVIVSAGDDWLTNGFRLFVRDTLTLVDGTSGIRNNGADGAGGGLPNFGAGAPFGTLGGGGDGGDGGVNGGANGGTGTDRAQAGTFFPVSTALGDGGAGEDGDGAGSTTGGAGGSVVVHGAALSVVVYPQRMRGTVQLQAIETAATDHQFEPTYRRICGGAGGGGGGAGNTDNGHGGGGGGGVMVICARNLVLNGFITAKGGFSPTTASPPNNPGRGGGGGGGVVLVTTRSITGSAAATPLTNITAIGGTGFVNGENGFVSLLRM